MLNKKIEELARQIVETVNEMKVVEVEEGWEGHVTMELYSDAKRILKGNHDAVLMDRNTCRDLCSNTCENVATGKKKALKKAENKTKKAKKAVTKVSKKAESKADKSVEGK